MTAPVAVDIISDVICPWCFIGKRRLENALALRPKIAVEISWRPYQLDPTIPQGGIARQSYLERKFGDRERIRSIYTRITEAGAEEGIPFAFDKITVTPNTIDPHRLIRWAGTAGAQDEVVERLFARYFVGGEDIGNSETLIAVATESGMDADLVRQRLAGEDDVDLVEKEISLAQQMGVTGVPCFIFDNRLGVVGAQSPEAIAGTLDRAVADRSARTGTTG